MSKIFNNRVLIHMIRDDISDLTMHDVAGVIDGSTDCIYEIISYPKMDIEKVKNNYIILCPIDTDIEDTIVQLYLTKYVVNSVSQEILDYIYDKDNYSKNMTDEDIMQDFITYVSKHIDAIFDIDKNKDGIYTVEIVE